MKLLLSHKIVSVVLSVLVLFSTYSFTVEKHYCGGKLVDVAVFSKAKSCCGIEKETPNNLEKPCCKNEVDIIKGQDELSTKSFDDSDFSNEQFLFSYCYCYGFLFKNLPKQTISNTSYSPPIIIVDIQLLDGVFLI